MSEDRLRHLFDKYLEGRITREEIGELQAYIADPRHTAVLDSILQAAYANKDLAAGGSPDIDDLFRAFLQKNTLKPPVRRLYVRYAAAALLLLTAGLIAYRFTPVHSRRPVRQAQTPVPQPLFSPGKDRAVLTLANGRNVVLDSSGRGHIVSAGTKEKIVFLPGTNTISTPRGGQYELVLSDGTRVWLNAASSLRFPTVFRGKERVVELTGEGYFEVARDADHPFIVTVDSTRVQVLGTAFDIMAYKDEAGEQTTLLDGSVQVSRGDALVTLTPGMAAIRKGDRFSVQAADIGQVIAWKQGKLSFSHLPLPEIMRQISRWYNVDVDYTGVVPDGRFGGVISRNVDLETVLRFLNENGIHCRQEGNRIIVLP